MNKCSESCIRQLLGVWAIKWSKLYANCCSLDNVFLYKISYTALLQILHILIPENTNTIDAIHSLSLTSEGTQYTVYHLHQKAHNTQFITYIRRHTISAYSFPHMLPAIACVTDIELWLLLTVLTLILKQSNDLIV